MRLAGLFLEAETTLCVSGASCGTGLARFADTLSGSASQGCCWTRLLVLPLPMGQNLPGRDFPTLHSPYASIPRSISPILIPMGEKGLI